MSYTEVIKRKELCGKSIITRLRDIRYKFAMYFHRAIYSSSHSVVKFSYFGNIFPLTTFIKCSSVDINNRIV